MKKYLQLLGAAAFLSASLFSINKTANAEYMETYTERRVVFECRKDDAGQLETRPQFVEQERYTRYKNTVVNQYIIVESDRPLITWNKFLGSNDQFPPDSRCQTVSNRLTNMTSALAAYYRDRDETISNEESYTKALEALEAVSQSTRAVGVNAFREYINEQILVASDRQLNYTSNLKRPITVAGLPTDIDQTVLLTLSPENAGQFRTVLRSFKEGVQVAAGGEGTTEADLPIEE